MALCKDVAENIMEYIDAELDKETLKELEKHSWDCPECMVFIKKYKKMLELTGKLKNNTFVTPEIRERLKEFLKTKLDKSCI
jgi:anti-sigma factor RsiW